MKRSSLCAGCIGRIVMGRGRDAADVAISTAFGIAKLAHFEVIHPRENPIRLMTLPRITLSPTAPRRKTPPQTAKWRELTLAALRKIGRKGNRAPNSDAGGES
jgi:hypothetical protein